ncbi:MAG: Arm DNA-binding domain-containing protein, partial [Gammaproteobacteria bacterium]|nr:Arm DNA-binding domain-containing protein [Gammaproteobacteria bacterium]
MERPSKLNAGLVKTVRRPGRYGDGRGGYGLSLLVKPTSTGRISRTWAQRLYINGRAVNMGLGAYPVVTLKEARAKALENRRALARGMDPRSDGIPTFARAAEKVIAIHRANWKPGGDSEQQWRASLRDYVYPKIGHKPVNKITTTDVMAVLLPIWN